MVSPDCGMVNDRSRPPCREGHMLGSIGSREVVIMNSLKGLVVAFAAATSLSTLAEADMKTTVGPGEGEVDIVAWPGYVERGESDKNYDWVTGFEKDTGCKVNVKTAATSDEMVALMNDGGFDLVTASGDASLRLVSGKQVQESNLSLIPSWSKVD